MGDDEDEPVSSMAKETAPAAASRPSPSTTPASSLPGDADIISGDITVSLNDASEALTDEIRVNVSSSYRPERSDAALDKHCFAYNIRITNESKQSIQLVSRRFEIQTIGSTKKDVVQ